MTDLVQLALLVSVIISCLSNHTSSPQLYMLFAMVLLVSCSMQYNLFTAGAGQSVSTVNGPVGGPGAVSPQLQPVRCLHL